MEPGPVTNPEATSPPRAFAQGVGVLLQTVGMLMFLSSCCICSLGGVYDPVQTRGQVIFGVDEAAATAAPVWRRVLDDPGAGGLMLTVMFSTVGGLALAVFGLGMQSDKPRAATAALTTSATLVAILVLGGVGLWIGDSAWTARLWHLLLLLLAATLLGFCIAAWRQVRRNPPTQQWHPAPPGLDLSYYYRKQPDDPDLSDDDLAAQRARVEAERARLQAMEKALHERRPPAKPDS
jgi:protein-S-isoprenylcysteine O-methyltransferase Ste14